MRNRLEQRPGKTLRGFTYQASAIQGLLIRNGAAPNLADVYGAKFDA